MRMGATVQRLSLIVADAGIFFVTLASFSFSTRLNVRHKSILDY
jgi:hypothetical protein